MKSAAPVYQVPCLREAIAINADWEKNGWQSVPPLAIEQPMGETRGYHPRVLARIARDDEALYLIFRVEDCYVRAVAEHYQGRVWEDSCVEFFFSPGAQSDLSYFNLEINCGGTILFCWNPQGQPAIPIAAEDAKAIELAHSLPRIVYPEITEAVTWVVECRLPFALIRKYCPQSSLPAAGAVWRANLYKCADASSHPHWLTWSPVDHPRPQFHLPQYFGSLLFD